MVGWGAEQLLPSNYGRQGFIFGKDKLVETMDNPVDVIATAGPGHFRAALQALLDDDAIDALLVAFVTPSFTDTQGIAHEIVAASAQQRKPLVARHGHPCGQRAHDIKGPGARFFGARAE